MMPEPVPADEVPVTLMVTTDGVASAATLVMMVALSRSLTVMFAGLTAVLAVACWFWPLLRASAVTPAPETPPTRAPTASAATRPTVRERLGDEAGGIVALADAALPKAEAGAVEDGWGAVGCCEASGWGAVACCAVGCWSVG